MGWTFDIVMRYQIQHQLELQHWLGVEFSDPFIGRLYFVNQSKASKNVLPINPVACAIRLQLIIMLKSSAKIPKPLLIIMQVYR